MRESNEKLKYNYVFMFAGSDFWEAILGRELYEHEQVIVCKHGINSEGFADKLFRAHWAYSLNLKINIPLKSLWFKKMYNHKFNRELPLCFVYMGANSIRYDGGFTDYVRKQSLANRQVVYHQDLISKKCRYDYSVIRDKVDVAITLDKNEAQQYGIDYIREIFYSKLIPEPDNPEYDQDVYFLGADKGRLNKLIAVYDALAAGGVKCKFQIVGVSRDRQIAREGIEYLDKGIPYVESLKQIVRSKCLLEIIQDDMVDITTRAVEAIAYRRRLLTDCKTIQDSDFNDGQVQVFNNPENIDIDFFKKPYDPNNYEPKIDLDPIRRLYEIQDILDSME